MNMIYDFKSQNFSKYSCHFMKIKLYIYLKERERIFNEIIEQCDVHPISL